MFRVLFLTASLKRFYRVSSDVVKIETMKKVFIPVMPRVSFTKWDSMRSKLYGCVSVMYGYTETFYLRFSLR